MATIFGIALIAVAILLPPAGYIDPTVLTAYGETLTFAGALIGVDYHYKSKKNSKGPPLAPPLKGEYTKSPFKGDLEGLNCQIVNCQIVK